ncbi:MAG: hypothetical protein JWN78_404 [Bacteroidota bacterium]|nr:hypothetical protein [Bacteroidota bacterium]
MSHQPTGNELFRFVNVRNPQGKSAQSRAISNIVWDQAYIDDNDIDTYISDLITHGQNTDKAVALSDMMADVTAFKAGPDYIASMSALESEYDNVFLANEEIAELAPDDMTFTNVNAILTDHMSAERTAMDTTEVLPEEIKLWENVIAQVITPEDSYVRAASIALLKTYHLVRLFKQTDASTTFADKAVLLNALNARAVLPASVFPLPRVVPTGPPPKTEQEKYMEKQKDIVDAREALAVEWHTYHNALMELDKRTECYDTRSQKYIRKVNEYENKLIAYNKAYAAYKIALAAYNKAIAKDPAYSGPMPEEPVLTATAPSHIDLHPDELPFTDTDGAFIDAVKNVICLHIPTGGGEGEGGGGETVETPDDDTFIPIAKARQALLNKIKDLSGKIAATIKPYDLMIPIGNSMVKVKTNFVPDDFVEEGSGSAIPEKPSYSLLGVGDLLKVEQEILCYEAGEVAHIENVMKGEFKDRSTRDLTRREETTITEEETITEEKHDLETTERSEMNKETSTVVNNDFKLDQGVQVTGEWGPVKVQTDTNISVGNSSSTTNNSAVNYSKSVTERASTRVQKRIRKETRITIIKEFEEINKHGFENRQVTGAPEVQHIVGIYRWVNKIYRNTLWNYGKRMMLEFMVPEPSAYHIYAKANGSTEGLKKPVHPKDHKINITTTTITDGKATATQTAEMSLSGPDILSEQNYMFFASAYGAEVPPPPADTLTIGKSFSENTTGKVEGWDEHMGSFKYDLAIPDGYYCNGYNGVYAHVFSYYTKISNTPLTDSESAVLINNDNYNFTIPYGRFMARDKVTFLSNRPPTTNLDPTTKMFNTSAIYVEKSLPISISTFNVGGFSINIVASCKLIPQSLDKWKMETYNAIIQAYNQQVSDYEQRLSRMQIIAGVQIQGSNPLQYQTIIKNELKKSCIEMMANQTFNPDTGLLCMQGYPADFNYGETAPTMNIQNAVGKAYVIRFFEQTFEWDNMTYLFYPYYWANKKRWIDLYNLDDNDPLFANFLKAGAARVIVPVRRGFEPSFGHFYYHHEIPGADQSLSPDDPTYLSIAKELDEVYDRKFVEKWDNVLPTNLVILQKDDEGLNDTGLPCWDAAMSDDPGDDGGGSPPG